MWLSRLSVRRPVLVSMVIGFFVVFGLVSAPKMPVELLPNVDLPYVMVTVIYPGTAPEDVENSVIIPLEDALGEVAHLKKLRATASPDVGWLLLELEMGSDVERAVEEIRSALDEVWSDMPPGARRPLIRPISAGSVPVVQLAVTGPGELAELTRWVQDNVREDLARIPGAAAVDLVGDRVGEVEVEVDQERLLAHHLTLGHVIEAVRAGGVDVPAGTLDDGLAAVPVRMAGAYGSLDDLKGAMILAPTGERLPLTAVAEVHLGVNPETTIARIQGEAAVGVAITKRPDANTVALGQAVAASLEQIRARAPPGTEIHVFFDQSGAIQSSIQSLLGTLLLCIALTAALLYLFLHDWRGTAIVAISIPCSLVGTLTFVHMAGFTINYMTLMGLAITVGTLVDASIVVLESIAHEAEGTGDSAAAADRGTGRVFLGVLGSTVTNIAVFLPIAFMQGIAGRFFVQFAFTVSFSMVLALFISFTLTPMLAAWLYRNTAGQPRAARRPGPLARLWNRGYNWFEEGYRHVLRWALGHRAATLGGLVALLVGAVVLLGAVVPLGWFSNPDQGFFIMQLTMPREVGLEETNRAAARCEAVLLADPGVETVYTEVGLYKTLFGRMKARNRAEGQVVLKPSEARDPTPVVIERLRGQLAAAAPGAEIMLKELGAGESAIRDDVMIEIVGPDPEVLAGLADAVVELLDSLPNLVDIDRSGDELGPQITVLPDRARIAAAGLNPAQVGLLLRAAIEGDAQARLRTDDDEIAVRVRLGERWRDDLTAVGATTVQTQSGAQVPLRELARVEEVEAPIMISRQERARRIAVFANLSYGAIGDTAKQLETGVSLFKVPEDTHIRVGGEEEQRAEAAHEIAVALGLAVILVVMLLAGLMESLIHPFTILSTLPLALVGVLLALAASGVELDIFGLMAVVMLVGIVVNNAILMIEETEHQRAEGASLEEALEAGTLRRMRAILMTSFSTVAGMLPLAMALGVGAELRQSMALVSIGGVGSSSLLVLLACPVLYHLVERAKARITGRG
ncbi:MAG: efflux RND transporter permease subunit [Pseudomonadota bacterium]